MCTLAGLRNARIAVMQAAELGDGRHSSPPRRLDDARERGVVVQSAVACLLAESPEATRCVKGSDDFVAFTAAPTATGWNDSCRAGFPPAEDARHGTAYEVSLYDPTRFSLYPPQDNKKTAEISHPPIMGRLAPNVRLPPEIQLHLVTSGGFRAPH